MQARFNPPPNWPPPPVGWTPPPGWTPPADWPPAPPGWQWWLPEHDQPRVRTNTWMALGGSVLVVAPFVTWASVVLLGSLNLFQLYSASGDPAVLPWLVVISAGAVVVLVLTNTPGARVVAIAVGFVAGGIGSIWAIGLANSINDSGGLASLGVGPFAALAGAVTMIVAGFRSPR